MTKNYITTIYLFCLSVFFNLSAVAQSATGTIKGSVIDSATSKPIDFMTIALKRENTVIKTVVVNSTGSFIFDKIAPGRYTVTAIAIGYNAKNIPVILNPANGPADLGNILMVSQSNNLKEVSVTADRPLIKQEVDRISYDIQADPESKGLTVLDMMRKVPLLSLDADDNIKLKGSGNYKILINGKPSTMVARSPKDVLRSMPASSILKIEVITTPPAKYDSEGLSGIINIITSKKIDNGYNGGINLRYQGPVGGPGIGGHVTVKQGKLGITGYGGTGFYSSPETESTTSRTTSGDLPTSLLRTGFRKFDNNYRYGGVELSYEIDTLNLLTVELNPYGGYNKSYTRQLTSQFDGTKEIGYNQLARNRFGWNGFDATLNYQLGFKGHKDRLLTFSYKNGNSGNPMENHLSFIDRLNFTDPDYNQKNDSRTKEQTLQLDYVHPLAKITIEGGVKGILRTNKSNFEYESFNDITGEFQTDPARTNKFNNNQDVIGAYNSYAYNLKSWGFKAGIRAEATFVKADFISTGSNVNTNYFNLIPTVSVNRKFKDMSSLNFGYTQRIERPGIDNLNPFVDRSNPGFETTGNPDLKAVLSNNFELSYSKFKKGSVNVGLSYRFANNTIQNVSVYNETDQITRSTFYNIGKDRALTTNLNINYPLTPEWNVSLSGNVGYLWIQGAIDGHMAKNDGLSGYVYVNTGYKFEHGWKANASFTYNAAEVQLQGKTSSYFFSSFSGSKEIIKDKLTFSAGINNVFSKFRYYTNSTQGANFTQNYRSQNYNRAFNVSLNWRFGKLKDAIKKNQRGIDNSDVKKSSTSGS
ncbi:outer membrane beta-barrel family protein [Pedobacter lusitanus]|uniref:outer membrane beta-barrel family protein n=1 Tax=Pedobacter lusitanus TaxID=1503925 RepID=UPI0006977CDD|nr:outer membrane beta-barrel family protein [Pedobacter lusitanus]